MRQSSPFAVLMPQNKGLEIGTVGFAINRRTQGGPVDHDLPVLVVQDAQGNPAIPSFSESHVYLQLWRI